MSEELHCKDCVYFNRFHFCTIRPDIVVKHQADSPICVGFQYKKDFDAIATALDEKLSGCLSKKPMIPKEKTLEERVTELEERVYVAEGEIKALHGGFR